ncbi:hypothetical protein Q9L58_006871 [Maublancomyces gigas]|uniref:Uncharacterized protein n=1 Tax=Discina gigas TaxID=1032678 RepID=A0ABR3GEH2_9PEZI
MNTSIPELETFTKELEEFNEATSNLLIKAYEGSGLTERTEIQARIELCKSKLPEIATIKESTKIRSRYKARWTAEQKRDLFELRALLIRQEDDLNDAVKHFERKLSEA